MPHVPEPSQWASLTSPVPPELLSSKALAASKLPWRPLPKAKDIRQQLGSPVVSLYKHNVDPDKVLEQLLGYKPEVDELTGVTKFKK
jgi:hypothetical protein